MARKPRPVGVWGEDLGAGFYDSKTGRERHARNLIRQLEHLTGKKVALKEAA